MAAALALAAAVVAIALSFFFAFLGLDEVAASSVSDDGSPFGPHPMAKRARVSAIARECRIAGCYQSGRGPSSIPSGGAGRKLITSHLNIGLITLFSIRAVRWATRSVRWAAHSSPSRAARPVPECRIATIETFSTATRATTAPFKRRFAPATNRSLVARFLLRPANPNPPRGA